VVSLIRPMSQNMQFFFDGSPKVNFLNMYFKENIQPEFLKIILNHQIRHEDSSRMSPNLQNLPDHS